MKTYVALR